MVSCFSYRFPVFDRPPALRQDIASFICFWDFWQAMVVPSQQVAWVIRACIAAS